MKDTIIRALQNSIQTAVKTSFDIEVAPDTIRLEHPSQESKGDYASNIAMVLAGKLKRKPMDIAHTIVEAIQKTVETQGLASLQSVEVAPPGFINFRLKPAYLVEVAQDVARLTGGAITDGWAAKKVMVEFAHPNPLKEFHIGHLRNIALGESLVRLLEASGATVFRANYESDIGMHTAKALWGVQKKIHDEGLNIEDLRAKTPAQKAEFLGQAYALGSKSADENEEIKKEILELNKEIYKNPSAFPLWTETRQWSLDYFDTIYKRLGSRFDRLFFESETEKRGRELVIEGVEKGIFVQDADGSIYFPGEKIGLNNCVFVTRENYATYEGKEVALEDMEYQAFPFDRDIHVVANEQINFFQIAFAAVEQMFPYQKGRQYHLAYGMVKLKSGKMSSRTGEVITADELIDMAKEKIRIITKSTNQPISQSTNEKEETVEKIAVAAVKYTMLRVNPKQDIIFDLEDSVSMEGDSGPYLLYAYARCRSVLRKSKVKPDSIGFKSQKSKAQLKSEKNDDLQLNEEELSLLRLIYRFPEVVGEAARSMSPNMISQYLFDLAQRFNAFYNKHQILNQESNERIAHNLPAQAGAQLSTSFRVFLTETTAALLQRGLFLLGIETVERM